MEIIDTHVVFIISRFNDTSLW